MESDLVTEEIRRRDTYDLERHLFHDRRFMIVGRPCGNLDVSPCVVKVPLGPSPMWNANIQLCKRIEAIGIQVNYDIIDHESLTNEQFHRNINRLYVHVDRVKVAIPLVVHLNRDYKERNQP